MTMNLQTHHGLHVLTTAVNKLQVLQPEEENKKDALERPKKRRLSGHADMSRVHKPPIAKRKRTAVTFAPTAKKHDGLCAPSTLLQAIVLHHLNVCALASPRDVLHYLRQEDRFRMLPTLLKLMRNLLSKLDRSAALDTPKPVQLLPRGGGRQIGVSHTKAVELTALYKVCCQTDKCMRKLQEYVARRRKQQHALKSTHASTPGPAPGPARTSAKGDARRKRSCSAPPSSHANSVLQDIVVHHLTVCTLGSPRDVLTYLAKDNQFRVLPTLLKNMHNLLLSLGHGYRTGLGAESALVLQGGGRQTIIPCRKAAELMTLYKACQQIQSMVSFMLNIYI